MASIIKRCGCPDNDWDGCPHPWIVRYRTTGGRSSRQREQSFGADLREAEDFALKVEHDKKARVFIDPKAGRETFQAEAEGWLGHHLGADSSIATLRRGGDRQAHRRPWHDPRRVPVPGSQASLSREGGAISPGSRADPSHAASP